MNRDNRGIKRFFVSYFSRIKDIFGNARNTWNGNIMHYYKFQYTAVPISQRIIGNHTLYDVKVYTHSMQMQIKYIVNHDYFLFVSFDDIDIIDRKAYMHLLLIHLYAFLSRVSMLKHH